MRHVSGLSALVLLALACNTQPALDNTGDEETVLLDDDGTPDANGKADAISAGAIIKGTLRDGDTKSGTLPASAYWAWRVTAKKSATITLNVGTSTASRHPVALVYGPQSGTSWGTRLARTQATSSSAQAVASVPVDGTYLVVISESARRSYAYHLVLDVAANACVAASGTCKALTQAGCGAGSHAGDARTFSCGGGLGVMCCLPGADNACSRGGGDCVPLVPDACNPMIARLADARTYSCGGGVGVECCIPLCRPYCGAQGSRSEGWYDGCSGGLLGWATCTSHTATCKTVGSTEGWYDGTRLIHAADCN